MKNASGKKRISTVVTAKLLCCGTSQAYTASFVNVNFTSAVSLCTLANLFLQKIPMEQKVYFFLILLK